MVTGSEQRPASRALVERRREAMISEAACNQRLMLIRLRMLVRVMMRMVMMVRVMMRMMRVMVKMMRMVRMVRVMRILLMMMMTMAENGHLMTIESK